MSCVEGEDPSLTSCTRLAAERRQYLESFRLNYIKDGAAALESYEKATLTLFGFSLAASVGFANELLKDSSVIHMPCLLWFSWSLQVFAILLLLASFLLSHLVFEKLTGLVDKQLSEPTRQIEINPDAFLSSTVRCFNWTSLFSFAAGLVFFLVFAGHNIQKESNMTEPKKPTQPLEEIRKGNPGYTPAPTTPSTTPSSSPTQTQQPSAPSQPSSPSPDSGTSK